MKDFIKKNNQIITIILIGIFLLVTVFVLTKSLNKKNYKVTIEQANLVEYFNDELLSFNASVTYHNKMIYSIDSSEKNVYVNSFVYNKDKNMVIIPKDMLIIFYNNNISYKLPKYSYILDNNGFVLYDDFYENSVNNFFIYDTEDEYLFFDEITLKYNDTEIVLSKYSYVIASNELIIYDYENDEISIVDKYSSCVAKIGNISIDLKNDVMVKDTNVKLLDKKLDTKVYGEK